MYVYYLLCHLKDNNHLVTFISVFITNNNVKARIIRSDIPAINGIIHVVDTIMYFPFYVAADVMYNNPKLRSVWILFKTWKIQKDEVDNFHFTKFYQRKLNDKELLTY